MKKILLILIIIIIPLLTTGCSYKIIKTTDEENSGIEELKRQILEIRSQTENTDDIEETTQNDIKQEDQPKPKPTIKTVSTQKQQSNTEEKERVEEINNQNSENSNDNDLVKNNSTKYRDALLKQINSFIISSNELIEYADVVYGFIKYKSPELIDNFTNSLSSLNNWHSSVQDLISAHDRLANTVKKQNEVYAEFIYKVKNDLTLKRQKLEGLNTEIKTKNLIDETFYNKTKNDLDNYEKDILIGYRDYIKQFFNNTDKNISDYSNEVKKSLDKIGQEIGDTSISLTPYSSPNFYPPIYNITRCNIDNNGGLTSIMINCYGTSF